VRRAARVFERFSDTLGAGVDPAALAAAAGALSTAQITRLENVLRLAERGIPPSPLYEEFVRSQHPNVLLYESLEHSTAVVGLRMPCRWSTARYRSIEGR
jgi:hypothetical protein